MGAGKEERVAIEYTLVFAKRIKNYTEQHVVEIFNKRFTSTYPKNALVTLNDRDVFTLMKEELEEEI
jgi:hypothetical protein